MQNNILLKVSSLILFSWYGIFRWIILNNGNPESHDWLSNPMGNFIAMITILYLINFIFSTKINKLFIVSTIALFILNIWCLIKMTIIFINDCSPINFGYEVMDISILFYYVVMMRYCYLTYHNNSVNYIGYCNLF